MLKIREYVKAESLEQAYELNQKKTNRILGGMLWMRLGDVQIQKGIDLSDLGLDKIEETEDGYRIGCMVTLRRLELHDGLNEASGGLIRSCVKDIVGVQFRNMATIGGSLFGRFGFSDVLTGFLALDTYVELHRAGVMPLEEFANKKWDNDILVHVIVRKQTNMRYAYLSHRNTKTDFPVLAVSVAAGEQGVRVIVGARPHKAMSVPIEDETVLRLGKSDITEEVIRETAADLARKVETGSNMRASAAYRGHLAKVLIGRGLSQVCCLKRDEKEKVLKEAEA